MFRIEVLNELSEYVPAHWIHPDKLDLFFHESDARKALRNFPNDAIIVKVE